MSDTLSPSRSKSKRERTRDALVAAAETLFAARGPDAVSIDEITIAAEVAKGTFYTHFADKDDIERVLAGQVRLELEDEVARLNDGIDDAGVRMANGLACYLSFAMRQPTRARTLLRLQSAGADPQGPINAGLRSDVQLGVESGRFEVVSTAAAVLLAMGTCLAGIAYLVQAPNARAQRIAGEIIAMVLRALGLKTAESKKLAEEAVMAAFVKAGGKGK